MWVAGDFFFAQVTFLEQDGSTPLHLALLEDHVLCVETLLNHGADPLLPNFDGETAVAWADDAPLSKPRMCFLNCSYT